MSRLAVVLAVGSFACSLAKRSPQVYRADTQQVLETRHAQLQTCYEEVLKTDATAAGTLSVRFVVERKTGVFKNATLDPDKSNASEPLVLCVMRAIDGLVLVPPDRNEGRAAFVYDLRPPPP